jgi:hypothetical protein
MVAVSGAGKIELGTKVGPTREAVTDVLGLVKQQLDGKTGLTDAQLFRKIRNISQPQVKH